MHQVVADLQGSSQSTVFGCRERVCNHQNLSWGAIHRIRTLQTFHGFFLDNSSKYTDRRVFAAKARCLGPRAHVIEATLQACLQARKRQPYRCRRLSGRHNVSCIAQVSNGHLDAAPVSRGGGSWWESIIPPDVRSRFKGTAFANPKFFPMVSLFFFMSFINTILDSLGSSLVITAKGGGTEVIPFLTVYAVWPCSFLFLLAYSFATQRFSRRALFNLVVTVFLSFYLAFGILYPQHQTLHLHALADQLQGITPAGLAGAVGMVRNWGYTLFYCSAELWGDVVLSLLFWGLANETTSMSEAPLLYPLYGIGANIGQAVSGRLLSFFSSMTSQRMGYATQMQVTMATVVVLGGVVLCLHAYIVSRFPSDPGRSNAAGPALRQKVASDRKLSGAEASPSSSLEATSIAGFPDAAEPEKAEAKEKPQMSLREAISFLAQSLQIRCLAIMALSQGLATSLIELAWKSHLHMLHPSPSAYAAFMGEVAMWTGIVTGTLMLLSPTLFRLWKWRGVARATPTFLRLTGLPFFLGCIGYALLRRSGHAATFYLQGLVIMGALLQVFGKGAKFSMFKPAEEMVYIGLDEQSRTKGKAAIDVVGAQTGKSLASILQQVLLVASAGSLARTLPILAGAYYAILFAWTHSVDKLSQLHVCAFTAEEGRTTDVDLQGRSDVDRAVLPSSAPLG